jgi:hypothetical protein
LKKLKNCGWSFIRSVAFLLQGWCIQALLEGGYGDGKKANELGALRRMEKPRVAMSV